MSSSNSQTPRQAEFNAALQHHNQARQDAGVRPLQLSTDLCNQAQARADELASSNWGVNPEAKFAVIVSREQRFVFQRGETVELIDDRNDPHQRPLLFALSQWLGDAKKYPAGPFREHYGYDAYTQIIWSDTTHVGFGVTKSECGVYYVVAKYSPAGNVPGELPVKHGAVAHLLSGVPFQGTSPYASK